MKHPSARSLISVVVLLSATLALTAQAPQQTGTLAIAGHSGQIPLIQINGKSYVDVESLARLTQGSLSFQSNQITLALPRIALHKLTRSKERNHRLLFRLSQSSH